MKVYHGSYMTIEDIDFSFCKKKRDFGKGFYVTKILFQAEYWAVRKGEDNDTEGALTEFEFDISFFDDPDLKVLRFNGYSKEWLDFVVANRSNNRKEQLHDYDIIEGPVANDDIATRVYAYINHKISKKQFLKELSNKTPTHQICFCSMRSLQALELGKGYVDVETIEIDNNVVQSLMSDYKMTETEIMNIYYTSDIYAQLADENTGFYLKPWQEIYKMLQKELKDKK